LLFDSVRAHRIRAATSDWIAPDPGLRRTLFERNSEGTNLERTHKGRHDRRYPHIYIREMRETLDHPLVSMELEGYFEQGRRLGIRILQPFWDAALVDFLYRTPPELLNRGGRAKGLVRETVARRFPTLGFDTQRKVLATRFAQSLVLRYAPEAWREIGGATALADAGVVDAAAVNERIKRILDDPHSRDFHIVWDVLASETWLRSRGR
jgi:Asparagine synthase